jgi:hypothetical protein
MVIIPAIPATLKAPCHVTNAAHPPTCHLHRGDQVFHSWFSTIHTMCFFLTVFFFQTYVTVQYYTYVYTQRYRHRIAASFSPKTKFHGSIDFSVTAWKSCRFWLVKLLSFGGHWIHWIIMIWRRCIGFIGDLTIGLPSGYDWHSLPWNRWPIEIDGLSIKMVIVHGYVK